MTREYYYAPLSRQKGWTRLLPRVSAALAQFVKPIGSAGQNNKLFQRFSAPDQGKKNDENQNPERHSSEQALPDNVIPLRKKDGEGIDQDKALAEKNDMQSRLTAAGVPVLNVLFSLKDGHKLLLGIGRRLYARMRNQDKSRLRKGVIVDHKV